MRELLDELSEEDRKFLMTCFAYENDYIKRFSQKYGMTGSAVIKGCSHLCQSRWLQVQYGVILFSKQPVRQIFDQNAVVVLYSESISGQDDFFVLVPDICQWLQLAVEGIFAVISAVT